MTHLYSFEVFTIYFYIAYEFTVTLYNDVMLVNSLTMNNSFVTNMY